jgi:hypothetical protein
MANHTVITAKVFISKNGSRKNMPLKCNIGETPKQTFNNILEKMWEGRLWVEVSWEQDGRQFSIARRRWFQSGCNFDTIVEIFENK